MRNPITRDLIQCGIIAIMLVFIQRMCVTMNLNVNEAYLIGAVVGILICLCLNLFSAIVMNISIIIRSFSYTPEEFASFLSGLGCKVDFTVTDANIEEEDEDE